MNFYLEEEIYNPVDEVVAEGEAFALEDDDCKTEFLVEELAEDVEFAKASEDFAEDTKEILDDVENLDFISIDQATSFNFKDDVETLEASVTDCPKDQNTCHEVAMLPINVYDATRFDFDKDFAGNDFSNECLLEDVPFDKSGNQKLLELGFNFGVGATREMPAVAQDNIKPYDIALAVSLTGKFYHASGDIFVKNDESNSVTRLEIKATHPSRDFRFVVMKYLPEEYHAATTATLNEAYNQLCRLPNLTEELFPVVDSTNVRFLNGTFDIVTGKFKEGFTKEHLMVTLNCEYDEDATFDANTKDYFENLAGSEENLNQVFAAVGYCVSNYYGKRLSPWFYGETNNGKSTLQKFVSTCVMPRGTTSGLSTEDLDDKYVTHRFIDSRLNLSGDEPVKAWSKKAVELWKKITGNDLIETNGKYANRRDIECRTHWWSCSNALPRFKVDDIDDRRAIEDRLWLIPTGKTVPHDERFDLLPVLEENKNAIITKAMHCLHLLYHNKIDKPPCPDEVFVFSLRSYLPCQDAGPLEFIESCFDKTDEPGDLIKMKDVAKRYNEFFGLDKLTAKAPNVVSKAIAKAIGAKYTVHKSDGGYLRGFRWKCDDAITEVAVEGETTSNKLASDPPASPAGEVVVNNDCVLRKGGEKMTDEKKSNERAADLDLTPAQALNLMRRVKVRTRKAEQPFNVPKRVKVMTHKADAEAPELPGRVRVKTRKPTLNIDKKLLNL